MIKSGGPRGFDAGKLIKGRKRHITVGKLGLMVGAVVHSADVQDRDGALMVLRSILKSWPWLRHVFAPLVAAMHRLPGNGRRCMAEAARRSQGRA